MPLNLLKQYNSHLEITHLSHVQRQTSLRGVFNRDFIQEIPVMFKDKKVNPVISDGSALDLLFGHLTTEIVDEKTRRREFELQRSIRLHWVRHHLRERKENLKIFSVLDADDVRTYIYDEDENYVIVLAPYRNGNEYYLLTAYHLDGRNPKKIRKKYERRLPELH